MQESSAPRIAEPNSGDLVSSPLSCSPFYFVKRYDASGPMTLEDECVTARLGYESIKMLDKSLHEFAANGEQAALVAEQLKSVVDNNQKQPPVRFNWHNNVASLECKTSDSKIARLTPGLVAERLIPELLHMKAATLVAKLSCLPNASELLSRVQIELEKDARANLDEVAANANVRLKSTIFFLS